MIRIQILISQIQILLKIGNINNDKMILKGTLTLVCCYLLILNIKSVMIVYETVQQRDGGEWSENMMAEQFNSDTYDIPSQYFLCGFALRKLQWQRPIQNCECKKKFYRWRLRTVCKFCPNKFDTMTSGFRGIFCRINLWADQISKTLQKNSPKALSWRKNIMCPQDLFVNGIAANFGSDSGIDLGLTDLKLSCSSKTFDSNFIVKQKQFNVQPNIQKGMFISSLRIKYNNNNVVGIKSNFEYEAVISYVKINYQDRNNSDQIRIKIGQQTVINYSNKLVSELVAIDKTIKNTCSWNVEDKYMLKYDLMDNVMFQLPNSIISSQVKVEYDSLKKIKFNQNVSLNTKYFNNIMMIVEPCSKAVLTCELIYSQDCIPFTAQITLSTRNSSKFIRNFVVDGTWKGFISRSTLENINQYKLERKQCEGPNLRN